MCLTDSNTIYLYLVQADHYGPAEPFVGQYRAREGKAAEQQQFYTKWVPRPEKMSRDKVDAAIQRSLTRMNTDRLDLMQFQASIQAMAIWLSTARLTLRHTF